MDRLSVVIPVRTLPNAQAALAEAVARIPGGAYEVLLDASKGLRRARNHGIKSAQGSICLSADDDVRIEGLDGADLSWFSSRPESEVWWCATRFFNGTEDTYTSGCCAAVNMGIWLGSFGATVGSFQAFRRTAFDAVGGYDERAPQDDTALSRKLRARFGKPVKAPFIVTVLRPTVTIPENQRRYLTEMWSRTRDGPFLRVPGRAVPMPQRVAAKSLSAR